VLTTLVLAALAFAAPVLAAAVLVAAVPSAELSGSAAAAAASASRTRVSSNDDVAGRAPCGTLPACSPYPTRGALTCAIPPAAAAAANDGRAPWET